jgi:hypothetical protein
MVVQRRVVPKCVWYLDLPVKRSLFAIQLCRTHLETLLIENHQKHKRSWATQVGQYKAWEPLIPFKDFEEICMPLFEIAPPN